MTIVGSRPPLRRGGRAGGGGPVSGLRVRIAGYVALTKPRIIELLLVTTIPTMLLAADGLPPLGLVVATVVGGTLAAGSANALNCYLDRDIDVLMHRTSRRPLVTGALRPGEALAFGLLLGALSVGGLAWLVNALAALLAAVAILFYVVGYTLLLKRRTPQNIVWGGAAGCMPVLIGWAAVRGSLDWAPVLLFLVVFFWTPPHYWPLALRFRDDYAAAGVPMLPVVAEPGAVAGRIVAYSWAMVGASLLLWPVAPTGPVYGVAAVLLGAVFLREAHRLLGQATLAQAELGQARGERPESASVQLLPMRLFHLSITYLTLLFLAVAVDPLLPF